MARKNVSTTTTAKDAANPAAAAGRRLDDWLCFALYSANLARGRAYKQGLAKLGLTYPQWITIVSLWEQDGQTVGELGDRLFLESNTLTPMLKKLESMGYLRRQRDAADERQVRLNLTEAGRKLREKGGARLSLVNSSGLKPDVFERLQKGIVELRDNLLNATEEE